MVKYLHLYCAFIQRTTKDFPLHLVIHPLTHIHTLMVARYYIVAKATLGHTEEAKIPETGSLHQQAR